MSFYQRKMVYLTFFFLIAMNNVVCSQKKGEGVYHNPLFVNKSVHIGSLNVFYADDGFYYMFGSGIFTKQVLYRSKNLVDWEDTRITPIPQSVQDEIKLLKQPTEVEPGHEVYRQTEQMWAPMIVKVGNMYNLYTSIAAYGGIICLQSNSPVGPYTFAHHDKYGKAKKLIDIDDVGIAYDVIDPCFAYDHKTGKNYLFFGSMFGIYRVELTTDGTELANPHKFELVAGKRKGGGVGGGYEGTMLYYHSGYWYLILSPRSDYRLLCWRSRDLCGQFVDENGNTPMSDKYGHEILQSQLDSYRTPDGYALKRTGHSGEIIMDKSGRYFIFCEASVEILQNPWWRKAPCLTEIKWNENGWPTAITKERRVSYENIRPDM